MWPLHLLAVLAAAIVLWKLWELSVEGGRTLRLLERVDSLVDQHMIAEALAAARESDTPGGRIIAAGLARRAAGSDRVARTMRSTSAIEAVSLQSWLIPLAAIASITPLAGFLLSVLEAMRALDSASPLEPALAAALVPAATGLVIAIPATVLHRYLVARIDRLITRIDRSALRAVDAVLAIDTDAQR